MPGDGSSGTSFAAPGTGALQAPLPLSRVLALARRLAAEEEVITTKYSRRFSTFRVVNSTADTAQSARNDDTTAHRLGAVNGSTASARPQPG